MQFIPVGDVTRQLDRMLNRGLTLGDNLDGAIIEIELTGEEQTVIHGLGRVPIGFLLLQIIQEEDFDPVDLGVGNIQVNKDDDGWLYFLPNSDIPRALIGVDLWSNRVDEWTKESLFLTANAANLKARLFVL